ncbi:unnamed protein product [Mycena citricolor]|uniref:Uncharacterized protein n=3 Tax=Mycena citricolor TaxID=2018698 RepID=A0AAD2HPS8_9AGAR|nr:unnamed protein product [Mycena citricolor]CAK5278899.1 unnamed protein product [Mycena citricolor]
MFANQLQSSSFSPARTRKAEWPLCALQSAVATQHSHRPEDLYRLRSLRPKPRATSPVETLVGPRNFTLPFHFYNPPSAKRIMAALRNRQCPMYIRAVMAGPHAMYIVWGGQQGMETYKVIVRRKVLATPTPASVRKPRVLPVAVPTAGSTATSKVAPALALAQSRQALLDLAANSRPAVDGARRKHLLDTDLHQRIRPLKVGPPGSFQHAEVQAYVWKHRPSGLSNVLYAEDTICVSPLVGNLDPAAEAVTASGSLKPQVWQFTRVLKRLYDSVFNPQDAVQSSESHDIVSERPMKRRRLSSC